MNFTIFRGMHRKFQDTDNAMKVKRLISIGITKVKLQKGTNAERASYYSALPNMDPCKGITSIIHHK